MHNPPKSIRTNKWQKPKKLTTVICDKEDEELLGSFMCVCDSLYLLMSYIGFRSRTETNVRKIQKLSS